LYDKKLRPDLRRDVELVGGLFDVFGDNTDVLLDLLVGLEVGVERRVDDLGVALGELFVGDFGLLERFEVGVDRLRLGLGGRVEAVVDEFAEFAEVGGLLGQRRLEGVEVGVNAPLVSSALDSASELDVSTASAKALIEVFWASRASW